MLSKYSPAQKAKSTAALLSALALFAGVLAGYVTDILPTGSPTSAAIAGGITIGAAWLVRTATFLTTSAPTLDQIAKNADQTIEPVKQVAPEAIDANYVGLPRRDTE